MSDIGSRISTWVQALATLATIVLVGITWRYVHLTQKLLQSQLEPQVEFVVGHRSPEGPAELEIKNIGPYPIRKVSVGWHGMYVITPKERYGPGRILHPEGTHWGDYPPLFDLDQISSGETVRRPITEATKKAIERAKVSEERWVASFPGSKYFHTKLVIFVLTYHRDFDFRRFRAIDMVLVYDDPNVVINAAGFPWSPNIQSQLDKWVDLTLGAPRFGSEATRRQMTPPIVPSMK